jgi:hypothetical protein
MKFGNYELGDWMKISIWYRLFLGAHSITPAVVIKKCEGSDEWFCQFYREISFLNKLYTGPNYISSPEELEGHVDKFLIKTSKLIVFI